MANDRKSPGAPGAPIPDLEVQRPAPVRATPEKRPSAQQAPSPRPAVGTGGVHDYFGSGTFDADHFGDAGGGSMLETDASSVGPVEDAELSSASFGSGDTTIEVDRDRAPTRRGAAAPAGWPTGRTPDAAAMSIDPVDIRLAADFGPAPSIVFLSPVYAARVFQRRRLLRVDLDAASRAFTEAERARDQLLVNAVQELRGKVLLAEGGDDLFAPVLEIERQALDRREALAGTNAEYDRRARDIEDGVDSLRRQADEKKADVDKAGEALAQKKAVFDRASAKKKRFYIEIRGILDAAEKTGGKLSGAQSARIAELEAAVAAHNPELEEAERNTKTAEEALAAAEAEARQVGRRIAEGARVRRALDDEFKKQIGARSDGVSETERQRADALAEVMRRLLALRGRLVEVPKDVLDDIAKADAAVAKKALDLEKIVRAIDSYDRDSYQRGLIVAGVVIAVIIALVVWAAM